MLWKRVFLFPTIAACHTVSSQLANAAVLPRRYAGRIRVNSFGIHPRAVSVCILNHIEPPLEVFGQRILPDSKNSPLWIRNVMNACVLRAMTYITKLLKISLGFYKGTKNHIVSSGI